MFKNLRRRLYALIVIYVLLVSAIFLVQRHLLYLPFTGTEEEMVAQGKDAQLAPWRDDSGAIIGWQAQAKRTPQAANKLLVFHGNAGNATYRTHFVRGFESLAEGTNWEVWVFEYPGFGARPGKPSRDTIDAAAKSAVQRLLAMDSRPLYILGESLGSGPACMVAAVEPERVSGVALVTPYARLADVAQARFPFMPSRWMLLDRWDNPAALSGTRAPVAVVIAGQDEVVGADQGELVFASLGDRPKQRWLFPTAGHNTLDLSRAASWWGEVSTFLLGARR